MPRAIKLSAYAEHRLAGERDGDLDAADRRDTRRRATREKLIDAARELLFTQDYFLISINDIASKAGLSRATFYLHYARKEDVLVDIVRAEAVSLDPLYRWFGDIKAPTRQQIHDFVLLRIRLTKRSSRQLALFFQATGYNAELWRTFVTNRERHIAMLGESIPAFAGLKRTSKKEKLRREKAHLLIYQIEQLAIYSTFAPETVDVEEGVTGVVDAFDGFVKQFNA